ncbi:Protein MKS1 [Platanthera guangdongensis]|uniref:Protein MKS1 n=1 Tax=Platanthera guangdongensis TaxID=2320717 RepID=A0ABR2LVU1_9ASPA
MDICDHNPAGKPMPRRELQLQGPRPSALKVRKDTFKIKKPPPAAAPILSNPPPNHKRPPIIIYTVSPKIIHTKPSDFMSLVQRLTGVSPSPIDESAAGVTYPSTSSGEQEADDSKSRPPLSPRILSLLPPSSTPITSSVFSPTVDLSPLNFMNELSPGLQGSKAFMENNFLNSPGNQLSSSPSTYWDLFNQYKEL